MAYNLTRETQSILKQYETSPPSFSVQLHHDNWTLNSGPKFLYNSPAYSALFDDIKAHRIPVDLLELFDAAKVPFYEGCMIVEIEKFEPPDPKESKLPEKTVARVLLRPNSETLFADLCLLNQKSGGKWTDKDALEVEAKILLATSPPLCLDPDPRLGKVANSLYRISLPRTPPPLRPKKRKANGLESTEEDEAYVNRKTKIIRFMDPKPTRSATPSYRLLDHLTRTKAAPPPQSTENNPPAVPAVNYSNPLHSIPVNNAPTQQPTPQPQPQAHTQTPSHPQPQPQPQSQSRPQSQPQSQPQPQQPQPPPPLQPQPQPQPQPQLQPTQPQQPPRSIATPVVAAPSTPGSTDTKKSTPKQAAKRTQTPGDGTLGTPTPSATPVQATPQLAPQHLRATNHPTSRPTSQSPHPTAVVNGSASTLGSSPRVAQSPALHAMAVAGTNAASSSSPRPPAQSAIQPQQGQPQPQAQAVPQARPPFPQQAKGFAPPLQTYMNMGAGMNPALYKQLAAQAQGQNAKAGMAGQQTQQQIYYMIQAQAAQAQAQAHAQGQVQPVNLTPAQLQAQARYAAQLAQMQAVQAQQQQQQQQNVPASHLSRTPMLNPAIVGATANSQVTSRSPMPNANGQGQHVASPHFAAPGQGQQSPQLSHQQQQQVMASAQAKAQYAAHLQQQQQHQQQQQQSHPGQTQDAAPTQQMFIPMNPMNPMNPQMLQQLQLMQQHAAQAQAGGRVGGYPMHAWQQLQMSMNGMNGIAFRQGGGQPHANLTAAQAAQVKAAQQAHAQAQSQGAGAR